MDVNEKNNEKPEFPLNQGNFLSDSKSIIDEHNQIKLNNLQTQEEVIIKPLSHKDQDSELEINKELKHRNSCLKSKTQYNNANANAKKAGQNSRKKYSFDKENDKEKKKNETNDIFYFDFERCHNWNFYFQDSNGKKLISKMSSALKQTTSPKASPLRIKKRIERQLSKFRLRPSSTDWDDRELFGLEKNLKK